MREKRRAFIENIREERRSVMESLKVKERLWEERIRGIEEKMIERENRVKEWIEKAEGKFREREEEGNVIFWNTAGVNNKDKEFWKYIGKFEFVSLCETWLEEDDWKKIEGKLPSSHKWECVYARREKKRGRVKGGFINGLRKEWIENSSLIHKKEEGVVIRVQLDATRQRQWEECRLRSARYNKRYKEFDTGSRGPNYLRKENLGRLGIGEGVRGLVRLRCGNMEEGNKYCIEKEMKVCVFCGGEADRMEHCVEECQRTSS
ncbi:hypothetical protein ALC57_10453 [Trachymyrmex cornetzi]|uniref:Uncharacterized protein n=1 Tax=Trachymyrmex cornetzi TaxID=471704 RepID=A0A195DWG7_9HYME|nr:hypothetical protein ALC57_10453 [Trachymyrmex cornetzi]